jgi:ribonuclease Z
VSLNCTVLGAPGKDNALLVTVDTGQSVHRLLFDCGDGCLTVLPIADILAIDHLFLSHLHMDHIAGFDTFFRCTFDRSSRPNRAWGPPGTARILQHRFQGFLWNLHEQMQGTWRVTDIGPEWLCTARFELGEAFATFHDDCMEERSTVVLDHPQFTVEAIAMKHRTTTLAYIVREKPRRNIDVARLGALGLQPGPWLKQLKEAIDPESAIFVDELHIPPAHLPSHLSAKLQAIPLPT